MSYAIRRLLLRGVVLALLCLPCPAPGSAQAEKPETPAAQRPASIGRWAARFVNGGLYLDYDRVPVIRGGLVQVFSPDASFGFGSKPPPATLEHLPDGGRAYVAHYRIGEGAYAFRAVQRIAIHPDNRAVFHIRAQWDGPKDAGLEWNPARLWAYPLLGARYEADGGAGGKIGLRPVVQDNGRLAPPWQRVLLTGSSVGSLLWTVPEGQEGAELLDGRGNIYLRDDKAFWVGYSRAPLPAGREISLALTLTVQPKHAAPGPAARRAPSRLEANTRPAPIADARRPVPPPTDAAGRPLLIPQPKKAAFANAPFTLTGRIPVIVEAGKSRADSYLRAEAERFAAELRRNTGAAVALARGKWSGRGIRIAVRPGHRRYLFDAKNSSDCGPDGPEGYRLRVTPQAVEILGNDPSGAFYGLQTLRQLLRPTQQGRFAFAGAEITDWPSLRFRGAHIFVGVNALPFHKKLIERIFARYKMNALVLECEYTRWKSHPEIHVSYSMRLEDLKRDVEFARQHFLEPIPLVNALGHSEWIFQNGANRNLAEDANAPHAYNASDPASYRFIFDVYREALDIFQPRIFHIGHDEVKMLGSEEFGKYPARPENIAKGITQLFMDDTNRLADWLRERGARAMLWGDMLLHSSEGAPHGGPAQLAAANAVTLQEAQERRALLPKDALIADWRYAAGSEQRNGLPVFQGAGFPTVGCPWYEPENIRGWAQQLVKHNALGLLQTTWAGFDSKEELLEADFKQFSAFVLAAEYAWSGSPLHPRDPTGPTAKETLPYEAGQVFTRSYREEPALASPRRGWFLNLAGAANVELRDTAETLPLRALAGTAGAASRPLAPEAFPSVADLGLRRAGADWGGVLLSGGLDPLGDAEKGSDAGARRSPGSVVFPIRAKARGLAFLHATAYGAGGGETVATYRLTYADGGQAEIPLRYGREIRALDDNALTAYTTAPLNPYPQGQAPLTLRVLRWTNPRPDAEISRLEFRTEHPFASPILFGVTGY